MKTVKRFQREKTAGRTAMRRSWIERLSLMGLAGLGFSGCAEGSLMDQPDMYGIPVVEFSVKGRVIDPAGQPVAGILVEQTAGAPIRSDAEGRYEVAGRQTIGDPVGLRFVDTDGAENGGDFATQAVEVRFTDEDRGDGTSRYERHDVDVSLAPKGDDAQ